MAIYKQVGYEGKILTKLREDKELFELLKKYEGIDDSVISSDENLKTYKRTEATYIITGEVKQNAEGQYIRNNDSVINRDFAFLDYDEINITDADFRSIVLDKLQGYEYLLYPTIRYTDKNPRYRLVLPLERPANKHEYESTIHHIADLIGVKIDPSSATFSQLQGVPVFINSQAEYLSNKIIHNSGIPYPTQEEPTTKDYNTYENYEDDIIIPKDVAIEYFKKYLNKEHNKTRLLDYDEYLKQKMVLAKSVTIGQIDITTAEECMLLLAYGNTKWELENVADLHEELDISRKYIARDKDYFRTKGTFKACYMRDEYGIYDYITGEELEFIYNDSNYIKNDLVNFPQLIRAVAPVGYNELKDSNVIWDKSIKQWRILTEDDNFYIRAEIERIFNIRIPIREYKGAYKLACKQYKFNPILDIFRREVWDGKKRAETLFIDTLGIEDNKYTREISEKALLAIVYRNFQEYIKFDEMIIFKGDQGVGKTSILQRLGYMTYYKNIFNKIDNDTFRGVKGKIIVEDEELAAMHKTDVETYKAWVSGRNEEYRKLFIDDEHDQQRRYVIFGTTNKIQFLKDPTGHRRFLILQCDKNTAKTHPLDLTEKYINQVWAEVYHYYLNNKPYTIDKSTIEYMMGIAREFSAYDELNYKILEILDLPFFIGWEYYITAQSDKQQEDSKNLELRKYIDDLLNNGYTDIFKDITADKQDDFTTDEIVKILRVTGYAKDYKDRQLQTKIKEVLDNSTTWKFSTNICRGKNKKRGYKRK